MHDFVVLWASVREDGLSLPKIAQKSIGGFSGLTASLATLFIVIVTLASVAIVVVNALSESSWGVFTIVVTIIAALITGAWMYRIRPGKVGGFRHWRGDRADWRRAGPALRRSAFGPMLLFSKPALSLILPSYALIASILPVWVLMCPRDYLSSYMKIGVMVVLGVGIFLAHPY